MKVKAPFHIEIEFGQAYVFAFKWSKWFRNWDYYPAMRFLVLPLPVQGTWIV